MFMPRTPGSGRKKRWCTIHPDRPNKSYGRCTSCLQKTQRERNTFKSRVYRYRVRYGITFVEYERLVDVQNGQCAICLTLNAKSGTTHPLYVDHNHQTGRVRGLLCYRCNAVLGWMQDDPILFRQAAQYLESSGM